MRCFSVFFGVFLWISKGFRVLRWNTEIMGGLLWCRICIWKSELRAPVLLSFQQASDLRILISMGYFRHKILFTGYLMLHGV